MTLAQEFEERARRGAKLLDATQKEYKSPDARDWREEIDWQHLQMGDICGCVLGQLYGDYFEGIRELHLDGSREDQVHYGFDLSLDTYRYGDLADAWRKVIAE